MRVRRFLSVLVMAGMAAAGVPAVALAQPPGGLDGLSDVMPRGKASKGTDRLQARGAAADGVIRRSVRLTDVEHDPSAPPQRRLQAVDVAVDLQARRFRATATLAAAPTAATNAVLGVYVGVWDGTTCMSRFAAFATTATAEALGGFPDGTSVPVTRTRSGAKITLVSAAQPRLASTEFECAFARLQAADEGDSTVYSRAYADNLAETYRPVLEVEPDTRIIGARKGKWALLRYTLRNKARSAARGVKVKFSGKGIQTKPKSVTVGGMGDRSTKYLKVKVRLKPKKGKGKKALKPRKLTIAANAPGAAAAKARTTVVVSPKPRKLKSLAGTYWWGWESTTLMDSAGWVNHSAWFVNRKWVYLGWAKQKKPRCSAKVKQCRRYTYNARKGTVKIKGLKAAKVNSEGFAVKHPDADAKLKFHPLTLPKKGTRIGTDLYRQDWSGVCAIMCTAWTDYLTLDKRGRFTMGGSYVGSWPGLGSSWGGVSPDQRGTYQIVSKGVIKLSYASGKVERHIIGIEHDPRGKPNAELVGLLIGEENFYE